MTPPRSRRFPWAWVALFLMVALCGAVLLTYLSVTGASERQMRQALSLLEEGRPQEAVSLYRAVAITETGTDVGDEAEIRCAILTASLENRPMDPVVSQAALLLSSGRRREAIALYRSTQNQTSTLSTVQESSELFDFQDRLSRDDLTEPDSAEEFYQLGVLYALYGNGSSEDVLKGYNYFMEMADRFPDAIEHSAALYFAGVCADRLNRLDEAIRVWTRLINDHPYDPHVPEVLFGIGYYYQTAFRDSVSAALWYNRLIQDYPENTYSEWAREQLRLINENEGSFGGSRPEIETRPGPLQ